MGPDWPGIISKVEPLCFQVHAGDSLGTAFAIGISGKDGGRHTMMATALHVVEGVLGNDKPIELIRSDGTVISRQAVGPLRIFPVGTPECDAALIEVPTKEPLLRAEQLCAMPLETMLPRGAPVGWLGYPGFVFPELCFFKGCISGYQENPPLYLIDGVAINGVSGGPAFDESGLLVGMVSAYLPNQIGPGRTLPGLMLATSGNMLRFWMQEVLGAEVRMRKERG
jgi:hypothetical protein